MSQNPLNLAIRFLLEMAGMVGLFRLGLWLADGVVAAVLALALSLGAATAWASFNVPGDRSRSGSVPVVVPGWVRLGVELALLGGGAVGWHLSGPTGFAWAYSTVLFFHYVASWDRVGWLLGMRSDAP